jgi:hypothetical protein
MRIGSIVIHCHDFDRTVAFWQAALHYVPREPAKDRWVVLRDPTGRGPNLSFQGRDTRPRKPELGSSRLYTEGSAGGGRAAGLLEGATISLEISCGADFVVLEDPGRALFSVQLMRPPHEGLATTRLITFFCRYPG